MSQGSKQQFQELFQSFLSQLIAEGMPTNEASAKALLKARSAMMNLVQVVPPVVEAPKTPEPAPRPVETIDMSTIKELYDSCADSGLFEDLSQFIYRVVSRPRSIAQSFIPQEIPMTLEQKEAEDKKTDEFSIDIEALDAFISLIANSEVESVRNSLVNATDNLVRNLRSSRASHDVAFLRCFVFIFEYYSRTMDPTADELLKFSCHALDDMAPEAKIAFTEWFGRIDTERYKRYLVLLRQHITFQFYSSNGVASARTAVRVMALLYGALEKHPEVDFKEFYNDALNDEYFASSTEVKVEEFRAWLDDRFRGRRDGKMVSFISFPFVLNAGNKATVLEIDAQQQMRREMNNEYMHAMTSGAGYVMPYFAMRVRRDRIIEDTLGQISVAEDSEFKKPLKIIFDGEEGIDAGGVRKEYFQVMTRQLLDPNFGMFKKIEDSQTLWFNSDSLESDLEFELIGTLMGIAIYNSIIIDLHFPMVVYRKLKGHKPTLKDLAGLQPATAKGLQQLLDQDGDVQEIFGFTFQISYEVFGEVRTFDLIENGGDVYVTNDNREEYVSLYVNWILEKSVEAQFNAFARGFRKVCSGAAFDLFAAEELELLLCGNPTLDFEDLQRGTHYEDGYTEHSPVIHKFWSVVHGFNEEEKKAFLRFMSGSDRAPIEGLSQLGFVISKNGGDSEHLPTAHTCFNHLLLPQYDTQEKLAQKLRLAINNSEGFGLR